MVDANQIWDVSTAIDWMTNLKDFKLLWIEEPTSPDDVLGHKKIADAMRCDIWIGYNDKMLMIIYSLKEV